MYICNPSVQQFVKLQELSHGTIDCIAGGFGFIPSGNEHIVIHLIMGLPEVSIVGCEILSFFPGTSRNTTNYTIAWRRIAQQSCPNEIHDIINQR